MPVLRPNNILRGKSLYTVLRRIRDTCPNVWHGQTNCTPPKDVILKTARPDLFDTEIRVLRQHVASHPSFRKLLDVVRDQPIEPIAVLEYFQYNLHEVLYSRPGKILEEDEVKRVTKVVLTGLMALHHQNIAHSDIKSDNVVVNLNETGGLGRIALIDLGDSVVVQPSTSHVFTHPTYRAPEALLGLPWTTKVDIWSLGTLVMWGLSGARWFSPPEMDEDEETYLTEIFMRQCSFFSPYLDRYMCWKLLESSTSIPT